MVNVTAKPATLRRAVARCRVRLDPDTVRALSSECAIGTAGSWSELAEVARLAGIQGAKQAARLIPLCHPLPIADVDVRLSLQGDGVHVEGISEVIAQTGIEMEALTACAIAGLTVLSALHADRPDASIEDLCLWEKRGGRSGTWRRIEENLPRAARRLPRPPEPGQADGSRPARGLSQPPSG